MEATELSSHNTNFKFKKDGLIIFPTIYSFKNNNWRNIIGYILEVEMKLITKYVLEVCNFFYKAGKSYRIYHFIFNGDKLNCIQFIVLMVCR